MLNFLLLLLGFVVLIFGANKLVDGASNLALRLGISEIVVGLTVVAFGTSAPELVVNVFASIDKSSGMVLGNVLGSNIFNVLLILGTCAIINPLTVKKNTTWLEIPLSLLAALALYFVANDMLFDNAQNNIVSRTDGFIFLLFFTIFLVYNFIIARKTDTHDDLEIRDKKYTYFKSVLLIILGIGGLVLGGRLIVWSAVNIATLFGMSDRVIGLTIISIGTSLPELATSIVAVRKKNVDIAIGNVVGSNIFNIFFILGISSIIYPATVVSASCIDILLNILAGFLLFIFIFTGKGRQLERWEGIIFVLLYIVYLVILINGFNLC